MTIEYSVLHFIFKRVIRFSLLHIIFQDVVFFFLIALALTSHLVQAGIMALIGALTSSIISGLVGTQPIQADTLELLLKR